MISRRIHLFRGLRAAAIAASLSACTNSDPVQPRVSGGVATMQKGHGCVGNSGGACSMTARVLIDGAGNAVLEIRTGSFDDATNAWQPDGYIDKVHYTVFGVDGKKVSDKSKKDWEKDVKVPDLQFFTIALPAPFSPAYTVDLQVNIDGQYGKKGESVVRGPAGVFFTPDITVGGIFVAGTAIPLSLTQPTSIQKSVRTVYSVDFLNDAVHGAPPSGAIQANCVVLVDDTLPSGANINFETGPALFVPPGGLATCRFGLTLGAVGNHRITVRADAVTPADFDTSNNSVSGVVSVIDGGTFNGGGVTGSFAEEAWYDATGALYGVSRQTASITQFVIVNGSGDLGKFTFTGSVSSGGLPFNNIAIEAELFADGPCASLRNVQNPSFVNNPFVDVELCATATGDGRQAIRITYDFGLGGTRRQTDPATIRTFGPSADFTLSLVRAVNGTVTDTFGPQAASLLIGPPTVLSGGAPDGWPTTGTSRVNAGVPH